MEKNQKIIKEKRETFHRLSKGARFRHDLYVEATDPSKKNMHPGDFSIALDALRYYAGVNKEQK